jgi:hypothetical protein
VKNESDYYSEKQHGPHEYLDLGNFELESGITLPNAKLAWKTHGKLNPAKDNAILFPHMWSGTPKAMEIFIGEGRPLREGRGLHGASEKHVLAPYAQGIAHEHTSSDRKAQRSEQILIQRDRALS